MPPPPPKMSHAIASSSATTPPQYDSTLSDIDYRGREPQSYDDFQHLAFQYLGYAKYLFRRMEERYAERISSQMRLLIRNVLGDVPIADDGTIHEYTLKLAEDLTALHNHAPITITERFNPGAPVSAPATVQITSASGSRATDQVEQVALHNSNQLFLVQPERHCDVGVDISEENLFVMSLKHFGNEALVRPLKITFMPENGQNGRVFEFMEDGSVYWMEIAPDGRMYPPRESDPFRDSRLADGSVPGLPYPLRELAQATRPSDNTPTPGASSSSRSHPVAPLAGRHLGGSSSTTSHTRTTASPSSSTLGQVSSTTSHSGSTAPPSSSTLGQVTTSTPASNSSNGQSQERDRTLKRQHTIIFSIATPPGSPAPSSSTLGQTHSTPNPTTSASTSTPTSHPTSAPNTAVATPTAGSSVTSSNTSTTTFATPTAGPSTVSGNSAPSASNPAPSLSGLASTSSSYDSPTGRGSKRQRRVNFSLPPTDSNSQASAPSPSSTLGQVGSTPSVSNPTTSASTPTSHSTSASAFTSTSTLAVAAPAATSSTLSSSSASKGKQRATYNEGDVPMSDDGASMGHSSSQSTATTRASTGVSTSSSFVLGRASSSSSAASQSAPYTSAAYKGKGKAKATHNDEVQGKVPTGHTNSVDRLHGSGSVTRSTIPPQAGGTHSRGDGSNASSTATHKGKDAGGKMSTLAINGARTTNPSGSGAGPSTSVTSSNGTRSSRLSSSLGPQQTYHWGDQGNLRNANSEPQVGSTTIMPRGLVRQGAFEEKSNPEVFWDYLRWGPRPLSPPLLPVVRSAPCVLPSSSTGPVWTSAMRGASSTVVSTSNGTSVAVASTIAATVSTSTSPATVSTTNPSPVASVSNAAPAAAPSPTVESFSYAEEGSSDGGSRSGSTSPDSRGKKRSRSDEDEEDEDGRTARRLRLSPSPPAAGPSGPYRRNSHRLKDEPFPSP
ncbi:hypothetical protein K435DRAFT_853166 [Dendrothele bispora CBS 962.96]|uniref:Uncharacterized protein n=1 Tax=Dendrothele bispora (strain CBS 962.96) TaxID=1314807 RepID=A0A4S8MHH6_DENBC|nr:hypothetical protein K435DRAFT_853166 [Dendrothele bispora CBS 962.96]